MRYLIVLALIFVLSCDNTNKDEAEEKVNEKITVVEESSNPYIFNIECSSNFTTEKDGQIIYCYTSTSFNWLSITFLIAEDQDINIIKIEYIIYNWEWEYIDNGESTLKEQLTIQREYSVLENDFYTVPLYAFPKITGRDYICEYILIDQEGKESNIFYTYHSINF